MYYSPPNKGYPQELPDRWRFEDGTVRTDLKSLSNAQLAALNWIGPISFPVSRQKDEEGNDLILNYDYDPETHKAVWYAAKRKFEIVDKDIDETPYINGEIVHPPGGGPDWNTFKQTVLASPDLNAFVGQLAIVAPIAASALPTSIVLLQNGNYDDFSNVWAVIKTSIEVPSELVQGIITLATSCNLPEEFLDILQN